MIGSRPTRLEMDESSTPLTVRNWTDAPTTEIGSLPPDNAAGDHATPDRIIFSGTVIATSTNPLNHGRPRAAAASLWRCGCDKRLEELAIRME